MNLDEQAAQNPNQGRQPVASEEPSLAAKADAYVQALVALDQFSGSVLIGREDQVLFASGYGLANREHGVANTPQTKFRLGSVTKQFTAMAVLILQGQGKLRVHDPVTKVLPDCPQAWERVTIHHLLTHTSGIPEHTNGLDWKTTGRAPHTPKGVIDLFRERPLDFQPGEAHQYSNSGYVLLGHIIEQVADASYEAFLQEHVLGPLGMANTGYDSSGRVLEHRATGYDLRAGTFVNASFADDHTAALGGPATGDSRR
jgi:CubicO group peptidase (beta-lactamase class C family)